MCKACDVYETGHLCVYIQECGLSFRSLVLSLDQVISSQPLVQVIVSVSNIVHSSIFIYIESHSQWRSLASTILVVNSTSSEINSDFISSISLATTFMAAICLLKPE